MLIRQSVPPTEEKPLPSGESLRFPRVPHQETLILPVDHHHDGGRPRVSSLGRRFGDLLPQVPGGPAGDVQVGWRAGGVLELAGAPTATRRRIRRCIAIYNGSVGQGPCWRPLTGGPDRSIIATPTLGGLVWNRGSKLVPESTDLQYGRMHSRLERGSQ